MSLVTLPDGRPYWAPGPHNASTYINRRCRCDECRAANAAAQARRRAERVAYLAANPGTRLIAHGSLSAYTNWGCHCALCRAAQARYMRERAS